MFGLCSTHTQDKFGHCEERGGAIPPKITSQHQIVFTRVKQALFILDYTIMQDCTGWKSHLSESRGNHLLSRKSSDHLDDFAIEQFHLTEGRVEGELVVICGDRFRHRLEMDVVGPGAQTSRELHAYKNALNCSRAK